MQYAGNSITENAVAENKFSTSITLSLKLK